MGQVERAGEGKSTRVEGEKLGERQRKEIDIQIAVASSANFWALQKSTSMTVSLTLRMRIGLHLLQDWSYHCVCKMSGEQRELGRENLGKSVTTNPQWSEIFKHMAGSKEEWYVEREVAYLTMISNLSHRWERIGSLGKIGVDMITGIQGPSQLYPQTTSPLLFPLTWSHNEINAAG